MSRTRVAKGNSRERMTQRLAEENDRLRDQDRVHWRTRKALLRTIAVARVEAQRAIDVIYQVENRCMAVDGPVTPTLQEITEQEFRSVFLALDRIRTAAGE